MVVLVSALLVYGYVKKERVVSLFNANLGSMLSDATGATVIIGGISGNLLGDIRLKDLKIRYDGFDLVFQKARLEYSLLDIIRGKKYAEKKAETRIRLERGSLKLNNNAIISGRINGMMRFKAYGLLVDSLDIDSASGFKVHIEGRVLKGPAKPRIDISLLAKPAAGKEGSFLKEARFSAKGPIDNMSVCSSLKSANGSEALLKGYAITQGSILKAGAQADISFKGAEKAKAVFIKAETDFRQKRGSIWVTPESGSIDLSFDYTKWPVLKTDITTQHLNVSGHDLSNIMHISSKFATRNGKISYLVSDISTESTILNYYPLEEMDCSVWADMDVFRVIYFKYGYTLALSGAVTLKEPHKTVFNMTLSGFDVEYPFEVFGTDKKPLAAGKLSGELSVNGPANELLSSGKFTFTDGRIGTIDYTSVILNIKGEGPVVNVHDSRIVRQDSFMPVYGSVDFRRMGTNRFFENMVVETDEKTVVWNGWDMTRFDDAGEYQFKKEISNGLSVGYRKQADSETVYDPATKKDEVAVEYDMLDKESTLEFKAKENEEFIGVKKKYKF